MIEPENKEISLVRQCELVGINRTSIYYQPRAENVEDLKLMRLLDTQYTETPFYGYRRMTVYLQNLGHQVNHKRVSKLMKKLGLEAIYPKPNLSKPNKEHLKFPYLLRGMKIEYADKVWATDITYIRLKGGFIYLLAIIPAKVVESARIANTNCRLCADKSNATSRPSNRAPVEHGQAPLDASGSTDTAMTVDKPSAPFSSNGVRVSQVCCSLNSEVRLRFPEPTTWLNS